MSEAIFVEGLTKTYAGKAMRKIVSFFPLTQGLTMMKHTFLGISTGSVLLPIGVMLGVAALCTILAVRFFRWE